MQFHGTVDVLAIGAHPDDVEFHVGGTLLRLAALGYSTGVLDMTRGEMASRGTPAERTLESAEAALVLGLTHRETLDLGDGTLCDSPETRAAVGAAVRRLRPKLVFTHHPGQAHPDHGATSRIVGAAVYLAGLGQWHRSPGLERHRPCAVVHFGLPQGVAPSFIVDITSWAERKAAAVRCHRSQLHDPSREEVETAISAPAFLERLDARDRFHGALIQTTFGEAFAVNQALAVEDPVRLFAQPLDVLF